MTEKKLYLNSPSTFFPDWCNQKFCLWALQSRVSPHATCTVCPEKVVQIILGMTNVRKIV